MARARARERALLPAGPIGSLDSFALRPGVNAYAVGETLAFPPSRRPYDDDGILIFERQGLRHEHPVAYTQHAIWLLEQHRMVHDDALVDRAGLHIDRVLAGSTPSGVAQYPFDFPLHGDPSNTIHAPWRSAMAQGELLSAMVRLAEATRDPEWLRRAVDVRGTLEPGDQQDWVTFVDHGLTWFEEYAGDVEPMRVLNGHLFAMIGLYDLWSATGDTVAAELFEAGAATVLAALPGLRVAGEPSWYGLRVQDNPIAQSRSYHAIHIAQLRGVARMTGQPAFDAWADVLEADQRFFDATP